MRFVLHDGLLECGTLFQPHAFVDDGRQDEVAIGFPEHVLELCREFRRFPLDKVEHDSYDAQLLVAPLRKGGKPLDKCVSMVSLALRRYTPWRPLSYGRAMATRSVRRSS